ncbi:MAG: 50S ribosomal protein L30e [Promethearchaeia archaeon]
MAKKKIKTNLDLERKKKKEFDIDNNIKVASKTGSMVYGKEKVLKELRQGTFKMIIISNNCPRELEEELNYYNSLQKKKQFIYRYKGSSWELGLAMAKPYMISIIGIKDFGDSDLKSLLSKRN